MKKKLTVFLVIVMAMLLLTSCGAPGGQVSNGAMAPSGGAAYDREESGWYEEPSQDNVSSGYEEGDSLGGGSKSPDPTEKIIYSADVQVETVEFDTAVEGVYAMLSRFGAFLESSNVSGKSYNASVYGYQTYRTAYFVIRVPVESFSAMTQGFDSIGSVLSTNTYSTNITTRYYDSQSRLDAYRVEQERLLAMLEKCETVYDMLEIESRLSEVRYQIEALESTLRNWQNEVDYSTVNLRISEVEKYTEKVEVHRTYWQQISDGFMDSLRDVGDFFKNLFKGLVISLPGLVTAAAFIGLVIGLVTGVIRRRRRNEDQKIDATENREDKDK